MTEAGKTSSITSFKDPTISTSIPIIDLVDAIRPGKINYEIVTDGATDEVRDDCYKYKEMNSNWNILCFNSFSL